MCLKGYTLRYERYDMSIGYQPVDMDLTMVWHGPHSFLRFYSIKQ